PGLVLALGGVVIYGYLSWLQTFTSSPGSGARACLLVLLAALLVARIRILMHIDRQARRMASLRDGGAGECRDCCSARCPVRWRRASRDCAGLGVAQEGHP